MNSTYQRLKRLLAVRGFLFVDADTETFRLIGREEASQWARKDRHLNPCVIVFPIHAGLPAFVKAVGQEDRDFSLAEIAKLAGLEYSAADSWIRRHVIHVDRLDRHNRPKVFSYLGAFVCVVQGSMRRYGLSLPNVGKVGQCIRDAYEAMERAEVARVVEQSREPVPAGVSDGD
jgi:hypothetical protein